MKNVFIFILLMKCSYGSAQITAPSFYGLYEDVSLNPTGGFAHCSSNSQTAVVAVMSLGTGKTWMDRNLGASRAATSATDNEAYGCLYQWGRGNDGHASIEWSSATTGIPINGVVITTLATTDSPGHADFIANNFSSPNDWRSDNNDTRWQGVNGVNNPCPAGYRIPTSAEMDAEFVSHNITNSSTAYNSIFKFTVPGNRQFSSGGFNETGLAAIYVNSTVTGAAGFALYKYISAGSATNASIGRARGFSVRCIQD